MVEFTAAAVSAFIAFGLASPGVHAFADLKYGSARQPSSSLRMVRLGVAIITSQLERFIFNDCLQLELCRRP
jgi:hypothetical protein